MSMLPRFAVLFSIAVLGACEPPVPSEASDSRSRVERSLMPAVAFEDEDDPTFTIAERMSRYNVPGLSFALINDGEIEWMAGYGVSEAGTSRPVTAETVFQAGSIAKPLVAVAAMRMRDAGLIDLDADVHTYLDEYVIPEGEHTPDNPVTFRNLLSHTAGTTPGGYFGYERGTPVPSDLQIVRGQSPANSPEVQVVTPPETGLAYSGGGYTIAQIAIQDVTESAFERALDDWVLSVVEMPRSTYAQPLPEELEEHVALGHTPDGTVVPGGWRAHPEKAAAGLWSTAADLARFAVELRRAYVGEGSLLEHDSAVELLSEQRDGHAFGFVLESHGSTVTVSHAGGTVGYRAVMVMDLGTGDGAVIMTNSDQGLNVGRELLRAASLVYDWPGHKPARMQRVDLDTDALRALAGTYDFGDGVRVGIALNPSDEALSVTFPNGDVYGLVPTDSLNFVDPETGVTVDFEGSGASRRVLLYGETGTLVPE